jgi:hypothetical protein
MPWPVSYRFTTSFHRTVSPVGRITLGEAVHSRYIVVFEPHGVHMKYLAIICVLLASLAQPARADAVKDIDQIVQQFQAAIIAKDGKALDALFLEKDNSWLTVWDDTVYPEVKAKKPDAPRVRPDNYKDFSAFVSASKVPVEEKFYNVKINTNGFVASVYFDFDFLIDGKVTNRGSESWHMVNTNGGWKISSMIYSMGK